MVIMSLDIGKKGAIVIYDTDKIMYLLKQEYSFDSLFKTYEYLKVLIVSKNIDLVVIGEAFGHRCVVKAHSKFYGVVECLVERFDRTVYYLTDRSARCVVLGKGNGNKKEKVQEYYKEATPDVSDACLFISAYLLQIGERDSSYGAPVLKGREFPEIKDIV